MSGELFRWLRLRWRGLFGRKAKEAELAREMKFHFDQLVADNLAAGMTPEDARFAAQREFGGTAQYQEDCRDSWRAAWFTGLLGDFTYAARALRRSPGFTAVAVFTLALGIGVNVVMFSLVRDAILRPMWENRQLNLVSLYNGRADTDGGFRFFSFGEYQAMQESRDVFAEVAAMGGHIATMGVEENLQRRMTAFVSENFFALLHSRPAQGRYFNREESQPDAGITVLVASHAYWHRLGRPANFVGSALRVENRVFTVIGIAPEGFSGFHVSIGPDVWLPLGVARLVADWDLNQPSQTRLNLHGSFAPGLGFDSANARMAEINRRLNSVAGADPAAPRRVVLTAPSRVSFGSTAPEKDGILSLFATVAFGLSVTVLLVACLNLANLLLARGVARRKEIAIRSSLGASRWCVVRGLLAEGLLLALLGGAFSLVLGQWSADLLDAWSRDAFAVGPFAYNTQAFIDPTVIAATFGFSVLATAAFGLWPALSVTRTQLVPDLKQVASESPVNHRANRLFSWGQLPLLAQIALSLALLFSATLFVQGARNAQSRELGFQTDQQLVAQIDYRFLALDRSGLRQRQQALIASVRALPGVMDAALATNIPYNFDLPRRQVRIAVGKGGEAEDPQRPRRAAGYTAVTRGYFESMGMTLFRGRDFSAEESAGTGGGPVAIIDESLARVLFGENDALGRFIEAKTSGGPPHEIVGIVRRSRHDVFAEPPRRMFLPLGQNHEDSPFVHVRVREPAAFAATLRAQLAAFEPGAPVVLVRPLGEVVSKNINVLLVRLGGVIFGVFGLIALVLAVVGVYGVKAHAVARRSREIGVRVALGARPRDVMLMILKQGAWQGGLGVLGGVGLALLAGHALATTLYQVHPADPVALAASALLLFLAVLLACYVPARRAMKVDPLVAIRTE